MNAYIKTNITKDDINQLVKIPELSNTDIENAQRELKTLVRDFYNKEIREYLNTNLTVESEMER